MKRILAIDDAPSFQRLLEVWLKDMSLHMVPCMQDALEATEERVYDVIILDLNLHDGTDYRDNIRILRRRCPLVPIIVCTEVGGFSLPLLPNPQPIVVVKNECPDALLEAVAREPEEPPKPDEMTFEQIKLEIAAYGAFN